MREFDRRVCQAVMARLPPSPMPSYFADPYIYGCESEWDQDGIRWVLVWRPLLWDLDYVNAVIRLSGRVWQEGADKAFNVVMAQVEEAIACGHGFLLDAVARYTSDVHRYEWWRLLTAMKRVLRERRRA